MKILFPERKRWYQPNRTIQGKFTVAGFIIVGDNGYVITPLGTQQVDNEYWSSITYGNGKYVIVGYNWKNRFILPP